MDKDELDIYLELAKEAETAGDYKTADKIDQMIKTSAFDSGSLPPWLRTWLAGTRNRGTADRTIEQIEEATHQKGRSNWFRDLGLQRRIRRDSRTPLDQLTHENVEKSWRGNAAKTLIKNLFFTRAKSNYEVLSGRFKEQVDEIMKGAGNVEQLIEAEITRLQRATPTLTRAAAREAAIQSPAIRARLMSFTTPMRELMTGTEDVLRDAVNDAIQHILNDPATRRSLGLSGATGTAADVTAQRVGVFVKARYGKLFGVNSEISDEVFAKFFRTGSLSSTGSFTGGVIDPDTFFYKMGGARLMPSGLSYVIPALIGGMVIRPVIDPPRPKPGPDVVPVNRETTKIKNELEADRKPKGQYRTPEPQLSAYILAKGFKGAFQQGKTTKRELYDMAFAEKGEAFANDLIQYALKTFGLGGGVERNAPIG